MFLQGKDQWRGYNGQGKDDNHRPHHSQEDQDNISQDVHNPGSQDDHSQDHSQDKQDNCTHEVHTQESQGIHSEEVQNNCSLEIHSQEDQFSYSSEDQDDSSLTRNDNHSKAQGKRILKKPLATINKHRVVREKADFHYQRNVERIKQRHSLMHKVKKFVVGESARLRIPRIDWTNTHVHCLHCIVVQVVGKTQDMYCLRCSFCVLDNYDAFGLMILIHLQVATILQRKVGKMKHRYPWEKLPESKHRGMLSQKIDATVVLGLVIPESVAARKLDRAEVIMLE